MKQLFLTSLALACVLVSHSAAYGCWCVKPDVSAAFKQSKAVFLGEVVDIVEPKTSLETARVADRFFKIKFKVERSWKGMSPGIREFSVLSAQGRYGCFAFPPVRKGERYLVYADSASDEHWTFITVCNRTTVVGFSSNPNLLNPDAIDPNLDIKELNVLTERAFCFDNTRTRRRG